MSDYSFTVFIDESGDGGFVFKPDGTGSSRWLILSAVVVRKKNGGKIVELMRQIRGALGAQPKQALHFVKLDHARRVAYARAIGEAPFCAPSRCSSTNLRCASRRSSNPRKTYSTATPAATYSNAFRGSAKSTT